MASSKQNDAIQAAKARVEEAREAAEVLVAEHHKVASEFLVDWAEYFIDRALSQKPTVATNLGKDKLSKMKAEFTSIVKEMPDSVKSLINSSVSWPHRDEIPDDILANLSIEYELAHKQNESFKGVLRLLIGRVGGLLIKYGFEESGERTAWQPIDSNEYRYSYGIPSHPGIESGQKIEKVNKQYQDALNRLFEEARNQRKAEHSRNATEARKLWNDV